jgi:hypothetical protein
VPLIAMAEVRASRFMTGTTHARPAVTLVSALPPVRLGKGIEAETYAAAGYGGRLPRLSLMGKCAWSRW